MWLISYEPKMASDGSLDISAVGSDKNSWRRFSLSPGWHYKRKATAMSKSK